MQKCKPTHQAPDHVSRILCLRALHALPLGCLDVAPGSPPCEAIPDTSDPALVPLQSLGRHVPDGEVHRGKNPVHSVYSGVPRSAWHRVWHSVHAQLAPRESINRREGAQKAPAARKLP